MRIVEKLYKCILLLLVLNLFSFDGRAQDGRLNQVDSDGNKSGLWEYSRIDTFQTVQVIVSLVDPNWPNGNNLQIDTVVYLKGHYLNGLKEGEWFSNTPKEYQSKVTFDNDTIVGSIVVYYPEGPIHYKGEVKRGFSQVHFDTYSVSNQYCGSKDFPLSEIVSKYTMLNEID